MSRNYSNSLRVGVRNACPYCPGQGHKYLGDLYFLPRLSKVEIDEALGS